MQVFRVFAVPSAGSDWTEDPFKWAQRVIEHDRYCSHVELCGAERCGVEYTQPDHAPAIVVLVSLFEQALMWVHWLSTHGCQVGEIVTVDEYWPPSVPSNWVARP